MIAPLRESNVAAPEPPHRLAEAHRYVATTLLDDSTADRARPIAPWKAWALVGWMVLVTVFWVASMLGSR